MTSSPSAAPVVPFELVDEAVHVLDVEAQPWSIQVEVQTPGSVDEGRLRSAVGQALVRHPMARARKVATGRRSERRYHWEITDQAEVDPVRVVDCPDTRALNDARARLQNLSVPLSESPPLRMRLARHPGGDVVMLNVNHAASDGIGSVRFLQSVSRAYVGAADPVPDLDPLRARDLSAVVERGDRRTRLLRRAILVRRLRDLVDPPARVAPDGASDQPGYGFELVRLSRADTKALVSGGHPGTVNDLLLVALHLAIEAWNHDHGAPARRMGVMVPVNLRPPEWRTEVMGNLLLPVRVLTESRSRSTPAAVLQAVTTQTRQFKERGTSPALLEILRRSATLPLGAKEATSPLLWLTGNRLVDTALLSNIGQLDDPPTFGAQADAAPLWFSAPARMPLGLSIGVVTAGGHMHLAFRYRHPMFGPDAASRFADRYLAMLERCATAA